MKILYLEDEPQQAELVCDWLNRNGHTVTHTTHGQQFLSAMREDLFDMAILDWEVPDLSGLEVLITLRADDKTSLPVLFATQRDSEEDIVQALDAGADDYLIKPLRHKELLARIEAIRRRSGIESPSDILRLGPIEINKVTQKISVAGEAVKVTQKDFDVAVLLLSNVGRVLSRENMLKAVWSVGADLNTRTVDVHVSRVRRALNINPAMGYCIKTIYQHGYRLEPVTD